MIKCWDVCISSLKVYNWEASWLWSMYSVRIVDNQRVGRLGNVNPSSKKDIVRPLSALKDLDDSGASTYTLCLWALF